MTLARKLTEAQGRVGQPNSTAVSHLRMPMDDSVLIPKNSSSRYLVQRIRGLRKRGVFKIVKLARHWSIPCISGSKQPLTPQSHCCGDVSSDDLQLIVSSACASRVQSASADLGSNFRHVLQILSLTDAAEGRPRQVFELKCWSGLSSLTLHYMNLCAMTMQRRTFSSSLIRAQLLLTALLLSE